MSSYSSTILGDTPQAYWRLDESGGNTAYDATGNGYNATLYGSYTQNQAGAIAGDTDASTYFTGSAGLQLPYTLNPTSWSAVSIEFWINANGPWQHIVATNTGSTTIVYVNAVVTTPGTSAIIDISSVFEWAGSYKACNLDEVAVYNYVLSPMQISNHYAAGSSPVASPGTPGGVRLLINDVWYPTIRSETINISRTANDPIPTFTFALQDDPSQIAISELQEVIFLDAGQIPNPTHNVLRNPLLVPYATNWTVQTPSSGGSITQLNPGVRIILNNATGTVQFSQQTQPSLVVPGQSYCLSMWGATSTTLTNCYPYLALYFFDANLNTLSSQTLLIPANTTTTRLSIQLQAPNNAVYMWAGIGISQSSGTNAGSMTFWYVQLEPMSFASGDVQQFYPTPFCANGQTNCVLMPDGTSIRQYRLFGGYVTKATAGHYIGNNRQWTVTVSGYAWLFQKQVLNDSFTTKTDNFIINNLVTKYFPNQFSTTQVATGATLDVFGYTYNGTMRDALDALASNSNFYIYADPYRVIFYQPPGYNQLPFQLSDRPDGVTSFPYYAYSYDLDGTQLGNATIVTGATGISAVEYDAQSIGYYNLKTNGQGIFWRTVNDSTIASTAAAHMRAVAENTQYNYARETVHLTTNQMMIPGYSVLFSGATDGFFDVSFLIQKSTLVLKGFVSQGTPLYECQCDIGAWNPDLVNITVRMLRKQLVNANNIGTPVVGLMATEQMTFVDSVNITIIHASPATYSMGIYGTSTYAASVPGIPPTTYGSGFYGDSLHGYL